MQQQPEDDAQPSTSAVAGGVDHEQPKIWQSRDDVQRIIGGKIESEYDSLRGCPGFCHDPLTWEVAKALVQVFASPPPPRSRPPLSRQARSRCCLVKEKQRREASDASLTRHVCQEGTDMSLGKMGRTPANVAVYWDYRSEV